MKRMNLLICVMALSLSAYAQDTRTEVNEFNATSNISEVLVYGHEYKIPTLTMEEGSVARFSTSMTDIQKKDESGKWNFYYSTISEGTYRVQAQVRIDGENGTLYVIGENPSLKVDGTDWTFNGRGKGDTYSYAVFYSPEIKVEEVAMPLEFNNSSSFNIPMNYIGTAIKSYSVVDGVIGGEKPYTFSKTSGPEWVDVSADGTVSGTPTTLGENDDLVIRVTDSASEYKEITVTVGKTNPDPADRTEVNEFNATSNIGEVLVYGHEYKKPTLTMEEGSVAYFPTSMIDIQKKDESGKWNFYYNTISEGIYRITVQVRIDGENGTLYVIGDNPSLKVDGTDWIFHGRGKGDTYSYFVAYSPEIVVEYSALEIISNDSEKVSDIYNLQGILVKRNATKEEFKTLPDGLYIVDGKKVIKK